MNPADLLKRLIAMPSVTPDAAGALDLVEKILADAGFATERMPCGKVENLWATVGFGESPLTVFAGHVDVVPPGDLSAWSGDPFCAAERGGFIYGRGACDMKAGVAAMVCALLRESRRPNRRGCAALLLTSDEEGEAVDGTRFAVETLRKRGVAGDFCVIGEPTCANEFGDAIKVGRRGSLSGTLRISGTQGHSAYPHLADNAARNLVLTTAALLREWDSRGASRRPDRPGIFPDDGMEVVGLDSGAGAFNVIPGTASARLNFRFAPPESGDGLRRWTEDFLARRFACADANDSGSKNSGKKNSGKWEMFWLPCSEPYGGLAEGLLARILREEVSRATGRVPELSGGGGASDGRFLRLLCREVAEFGPVGRTMHQADERVWSADVSALADIYERVASRMPEAAGGVGGAGGA